jgi:ribosomal protein S18 acetylase RimI-like enzyme
MSIEIRKAKNEELKRIQELNHKLFLKEFNEYDKTLDCNWSLDERGEEYFKERIGGQNSVCFVAADGGNIVGYIAGSLTETESFRLDLGQMAEGEDMYIEEEYRGQGLGHKLMGAFLDWCKERGVSRVKLVAWSGNGKAIKLYEELGFKKYSLSLEKEL